MDATKHFKTAEQVEKENPGYVVDFLLPSEESVGTIFAYSDDTLIKTVACPDCDGEGYELYDHPVNTCAYGQVSEQCGICNGNGTVFSDEIEFSEDSEEYLQIQIENAIDAADLQINDR